MTFEFGRAETPTELEAVQKLRYRVYVEELGRYRAAADGESGRFAEPEDESGWHFYVRDGDEVIAAARVSWGGHGFSARQLDQYELGQFLDELPADVVAVAERLAILPRYRGSGLLDQIIARNRPFLEAHGLRVVIGCCEPHLLSLYLGMGQRTYATHNINSPEAGYLIPLVNFVPDIDALRGVGEATPPDALPACVERLLGQSGTVRSHVESEPDAYWDDIRRTLNELHEQGISAFDGFSDDEASRCIARSNIIACAVGDRLLKLGGSARNVFVVLDGMLEVRDGDRLVGVLTAGDVFGEMAFLLEQPRAYDVDAATDGTRILSLSEGALRKMIVEDATVAAKLLLNISKMLCVRLVRAN